jgi:hypothetical protein
MQLRITQRVDLLETNGEIVQDLQAVRLFRLYSGRNAWWSVWVEDRYGWFFSTISEAKTFAEKLRTQGTVFYISELPALAVSSQNFLILLAQLSSRPFEHYSQQAIVPAHPTRPLIENARDNYLSVGVPLGHFLLSFDTGGRFWTEKSSGQARKVLMMKHEQPADAVFEQLSENKLPVRRSKPDGVNYPLAWRVQEEQVDPAATLALVAAFQRPT